MPSIHQAVLVEESMLILDVQPGGIYVDGTLGGATHTEELLKRSAPTGRVLSLDVDVEAMARAYERLHAYGERWRLRETNFRHLESAVREEGMAPVDGILLDLGLSSDELEDPSRGFTFQKDGPLDMRLGPKVNEDGLTASEIVNGWSTADLEKMIRNFGEERFARRIAEAIVEARRSSRIVGTLDLVAVIKRAVPSGYEQGRIHPATRTFQALRIAVNDELEALKAAIEGAKKILKPGGKLAVISFHSLEDRIVKQAFRSEDWQALTKRPTIASEEEIRKNPRARSAKLRAAVWPGIEASDKKLKSKT
jgi:16S rRNA (cytosine1402-N4)-methyltransferase